MTPAERAAVRLVIEAFRDMLKDLYRQDERGNTADRAMKKLDDADGMLKPTGEPK